MFQSCANEGHTLFQEDITRYKGFEIVQVKTIPHFPQTDEVLRYTIPLFLNLQPKPVYRRIMTHGEIGPGVMFRCIKMARGLTMYISMNDTVIFRP